MAVLFPDQQEASVPAPTPVRTEHRFSVRVDYFDTLADAQAYADASQYRCDVGHTPVPARFTDTGGANPLAGLYGVTVHDRPGEGWYG